MEIDAKIDIKASFSISISTSRNWTCDGTNFPLQSCWFANHQRRFCLQQTKRHLKLIIRQLAVEPEWKQRWWIEWFAGFTLCNNKRNWQWQKHHSTRFFSRYQISERHPSCRFINYTFHAIRCKPYWNNMASRQRHVVKREIDSEFNDFRWFPFIVNSAIELVVVLRYRQTCSEFFSSLSDTQSDLIDLDGGGTDE